MQDVKTAPGTSAIVQLVCIDDDAQRQRLDVIWDAETDARIRPRRIHGVGPGSDGDHAAG